jgi:putative peptide zinc metalloprotease protein
VSANLDSCDLETYELGQARLRLRTDLRFSLHGRPSDGWYLVEDEARGRYFRIGLTEYLFLSLLDGHRTLDDVQAEMASWPGCEGIDTARAAEISRWVIEAGLAESRASLAAPRLQRRRLQEFERQAVTGFNPIMWRLPLFNPDPALSMLYRWLRPGLGWPLMLAWVWLCLIGASCLVLRWDDFWTARIEATSPVDFLWLGGTWLLLKLVHESAHGLACKRFGGRVPRAGVMLLLLVPLPFVDVTSAWGFAKRSQRVLTAAAGMLAELAMAAMAAWMWYYTQPGPLQYHLANLITVGTLATLLVNLNPLMRFDGYYILSDFLQIPNLHSRSRQVLVVAAKRLFLGIRPTTPASEGWLRRTLLGGFGLAGLIWQTLVTIGLSLAAINIWPGIGLVGGATAVALWLGRPIWRLARLLLGPHAAPASARGWLAGWSVAVVLIVVAAGVWIPAPGSLRVPVVLQHDREVIRAKTAGFVSHIHVKAGESITAGQPLLTLVNRELQLKIEQTQVKARQAELQAQIALVDEDISRWQWHQETLEAHRQQLSQLQEQARGLELTASRDGVVVAALLESLRDQLVYEGQELLSIVRPGQVRAVALVHQEDARWLRDVQPALSWISLWGTGGRRLECRLERLHPRAGYDVPHAALASSIGGPVAVVNRQQTETGRERQSDSLLASGSGMGHELNNFEGRAGDPLARLARGHEAWQASLTETARGLKTTRPYVQLEASLYGVPISRAADRPRANRWRLPIESLQAGDPTLEAALGLYDGRTGVLVATGRQAALGPYVWHQLQSWVRDRLQRTHGL